MGQYGLTETIYYLEEKKSCELFDLVTLTVGFGISSKWPEIMPSPLVIFGWKNQFVTEKELKNQKGDEGHRFSKRVFCIIVFLL